MKYAFLLNYSFSGAADNNFAKRLPRNNEKSFQTRTEHCLLRTTAIFCCSHAATVYTYTVS